MRAMASVIVKKCASNFLYFTGGPPKRRGALGNLPPTLPLEGPECINNAR